VSEPQRRRTLDHGAPVAFADLGAGQGSVPEAVALAAKGRIPMARWISSG
jgi:hypothetical protein